MAPLASALASPARGRGRQTAFHGSERALRGRDCRTARLRRSEARASPTWGCQCPQLRRRSLRSRLRLHDQPRPHPDLCAAALGTPLASSPCSASAVTRRLAAVWHVCACGCRRRFHPTETTNIYYDRRHYWRSRRAPGERRWCAGCHRSFAVGGRGRAGRRQRFHNKSCASRARERERRRTSSVPRLRATSVGALAAAIDGEGHISRDLKYLEIGNTVHPWLAGLRQRCGGVGSIRGQVPRVRHHKKMWRWRTYGPDACAILVQCLPQLVIKRARTVAFLHHWRTRRRVVLTWAY